VAEGVADVLVFRWGRRAEIGAVDDVAQVGLLGAQVVEKGSYIGGDRSLPGDVNGR
jgi:hypothetical protein